MSDTFRVEVDAIEVTYGGLFGGEADAYRKFVPGMKHFFINDIEVPIEEYQTALGKMLAIGAPGVALPQKEGKHDRR